MAFTIQSDPSKAHRDLKRFGYVAECKLADGAERTVTAVVNTARVDRDREIILPKGIDLEQFRKNPVILWAHDYWSLPVARAMWVDVKSGKLKTKIEFPPAGKYEQADAVFEMFKDGLLSAFSIGFVPLDGHSPTPDEIKKKPDWAEARFVYTKTELLEISAVPVPSNADAVATAVGKGLSIPAGLASLIPTEKAGIVSAPDPEPVEDPPEGVAAPLRPSHADTVAEVRKGLRAFTASFDAAETAREAIRIARGGI